MRGGERGEEVREGQGTGEWKGIGRDAGKGEGRREEGWKKERRGGMGEKKSENTPSANFCLRPWDTAGHC